MKQNIKKNWVKNTFVLVINDVTQIKQVIHVLEFAPESDSKTKVTKQDTLCASVWTSSLIFCLKTILVLFISNIFQTGKLFSGKPVRKNFFVTKIDTAHKIQRGRRRRRCSIIEEKYKF